MRLRPRQLIGFGLAAAAVATTPALGQSADALIDKLLEKGVLSLEEANELRDEADKNFTTSYQVKSGMPDWVTSFKLNGDFRGRLEGFYSDNPAFVDRSRFRYRLRFGATAVMKDQLEVGFRLASGDFEGAQQPSAGTDPISQNQSFQNNASKKGVFIDTAYARWSPLNTPTLNGGLIIGKMENPFVFSDLAFDRDYTPEGAALQFAYTLHERHVGRFNGGAFVVDEVGSSSDDPYMYGAQFRLDSTWSKHWSTTFGVAVLAITGEQFLNNTPTTNGITSTVPDVNSGNTRLANGQLAGDFVPVIADATVTYTLDKVPYYNGPFPIAVAGDYIMNTGVDDKDTGYSVGVTFGKSGKRGLWDVSYRWKHLEADAWYEEMVDSDTGAFYAAPPPGTAATGSTGVVGYRSGTNVRAHVLKANYSPTDSLTLGVTAFLAELIDLPTVPAGRNPDSEMVRLQADAVFKF
jgi:hypothetical protein